MTASSSCPGSQHPQCHSQIPCAPRLRSQQACRLLPGHYPGAPGCPLPRRRPDHCTATLQNQEASSPLPTPHPDLPSQIFAPLCILVSSDAHTVLGRLQHSEAPATSQQGHGGEGQLFRPGGNSLGHACIPTAGPRASLGRAASGSFVSGRRLRTSQYHQPSPPRARSLSRSQTHARTLLARAWRTGQPNAFSEPKGRRPAVWQWPASNLEGPASFTGGRALG